MIENPTAPVFITATPLILIGEFDRITVDIGNVSAGVQNAHILFAVTSSAI